MPRQESEFEYQTVTRAGTPTEDTEKITKVVAYLKSKKSAWATRLGTNFVTMLQEKEKLDEKLKDFKEEIRPLVSELFDTKDEAWTRVLETASVVITLGKTETRKAFDKDKFIERIAKEFPELMKGIQVIEKECTKVSEVAAKFSADLKTEGIAGDIGNVLRNLFGKLKVEINKVVSYVKNYFTGYDKKLNEWKQILTKNTDKNLDNWRNDNPGEAKEAEVPKEEEKETPIEQPAIEAGLPESYEEKRKKYISEANKWL